MTINQLWDVTIFFWGVMCALVVVWGFESN